MEPFLITNTDVVIRLILAMLLGCLVGSERLFAGKTASMRTYSLVSLGSTVYVVVSLLVTNQYIQITSFDPLRMASQVVVGVGFLGAGLIVFKDSKLNGLTTAAGLWLSAAVGVAVGYGLFELAIMASLFLAASKLTYTLASERSEVTVTLVTVSIAPNPKLFISFCKISASSLCRRRLIFCWR